MNYSTCSKFSRKNTVCSCQKFCPRCWPSTPTTGKVPAKFTKCFTSMKTKFFNWNRLCLLKGMLSPKPKSGPLTIILSITFKALRWWLQILLLPMSTTGRLSKGILFRRLWMIPGSTGAIFLSSKSLRPAKFRAKCPAKFRAKCIKWAKAWLIPVSSGLSLVQQAGKAESMLRDSLIWYLEVFLLLFSVIICHDKLFLSSAAGPTSDSRLKCDSDSEQLPPKLSIQAMIESKAKIFSTMEKIMENTN